MHNHARIGEGYLNKNKNKNQRRRGTAQLELANKKKRKKREPFGGERRGHVLFSAGSERGELPLRSRDYA